MIVERFKQSAGTYEHKIALKTAEKSLTYGELDRRSDAVARMVLQRYRASGVTPGEQTAALLFNDGINQVVSLLAVLKARKIVVPFDGTYPDNRLRFMLEDSGARMILTDRDNLQLAKTLAQGLEHEATVLDIDETGETPAHEEPFIPAEVSSDHPAYIIYTSATTGKPKGVLQTCENVVFHADNYISALSITPGDRLTFISSFSHDGACQDIYGAIFSGAALYPFDIRRTPAPELARHFITEGITIYHSVPTVFRYFVDSLTDSLARQETFHSPRLVVTGGEPLYAGDLTRVREFFPRALLAHMYGQSESSVNTMGFVDMQAGGAEISLGDALEGVELLLLDENGEEVLGYETAEIFVVCDHIAPGYWRNPTETAKAFLDDEELGKVYRTGDLGRRNYAGRIEFQGRKDHQVKIRGFRVELFEIETLLKAYEGIDDAVVTTVEANEEGDVQLAAYIVSQKEWSAPGLGEYLARHVPNYMVPAFFTSIEEIPLTSTGKTDRAALPEPDAAPETEYEAPRNPVEKNLVEVWSGVLGRDIGINDNFFQVGGDSIKAILVSTRLRKFGYNLEIRDLLLHPRIKELAERVTPIRPDADEDWEKGPRPIAPEQLASVTDFVRHHIGGDVEIGTVYPLSPMQKTMLYYSLSGSNKEVFFIRDISTWQGPVQVDRLEESVNKMVARHDILRTNFIYEGLDEPLQVVLKQRKVEFQYEDIAGLKEEEKTPYMEAYKIKDVEKGFDLRRDMLLRITLFRFRDELYYLMLSKHYILMDGWCIGIVNKELGEIYGALTTGSSPRLNRPAPYRHYIGWLERQDKTMGLEFWRGYLESYRNPGGLVPTQPGKSPVQDNYHFDMYNFAIPVETVDALKQLAAQCQVTLNILFQTLWGILLQIYNNRDDVVFGGVVSGRPPEIEGIEDMVGLFINTVPVRVKAPKDLEFSRLLKNMQSDSIAAKSYEYLPFTQILGACDLSENIIDNLMTFQNFAFVEQMKRPNRPQPDADAASQTTGSFFHQSNYDFNIIIMPLTPFRVRFMYNASAYDEAFLKRVQQHMEELIRQVTENENIRLGDIRITYDYIAAESSILQQEEEDEWSI
ncbi:MAG: AMP-binding protein [bacterium]|nr:AMP-binding protein [bacterium]